MPESRIQDKAAITGIGQTEFSSGLNRSVMDMAAEAILKAIDDAGLRPEEIDGMSRYNIQDEWENHVHQAVGLGEISYYADQPHGGGSYGGVIMSAALGVAAGLCNHVIAFRSRARGRKSVFGSGTDQGGRPWEKTAARISGAGQYHVPFGLQSPVQEMAVIARRYMHDYGVTQDHFANVAIALRNHAVRNPLSVMGRRGPITREDYHQARLIADPLRLFDCCIETDGAVAVVVSRTEAARSMRQKPAIIHAVAQHTQPAHYHLSEWWRFDRDSMALELGRRLFAASDFKHHDIDAVMVYDHFTPMVLLALEDLGFCQRGEGGAFSENGALQGPGGRLPINTSGGQHSEAFIHGFNNVTEGVRQIRGTSTTQVPGARAVVVSAASSDPTGAFILRGET
ncbi:MAG: lipid-transfer protein [Dehalococcoidia bacterium]